MSAGAGRLSERATISPSASSVALSSPQRTRKRYAFAPSWTTGTVLVASPKATGSTPEASGSSVPACPAFLALNRSLSRPTAWVEETPTGLSRLIQPSTSTRVERACGALRPHLCDSAPLSGGCSLARPLMAHPHLDREVRGRAQPRAI